MEGECDLALGGRFICEDCDESQDVMPAAWASTTRTFLPNRERALGRLLARTGNATYLVHIPIVVHTAVLVSDVGLSKPGRLLL
ncbi:MAG: hypothetical protein GY788_03700 [bacterium]|nr:hypothetical protein [bacterium]